MIGYDDDGNQYDSPAGQSKIRNTVTTADREARQRDHEWCVARMRAMKKAKITKVEIAK